MLIPNPYATRNIVICKSLKTKDGSPAWARTTITISNTESATYRVFNGLKCRNGPEKLPLVHNSYTEVSLRDCANYLTRAGVDPTDLVSNPYIHSGSAVPLTGAFTPVLAKHSKSLNLLDSISVGVDRMQRNFGPMQKQVEAWRETELSTVAAKMIVYEAFIESELDVPKHLARRVHDFYFNPQYEEFKARTLWSLSNASTSAFKELEPIPQFKATAKLSGFLEQRYSRKF